MRAAAAMHAHAAAAKKRVSMHAHEHDGEDSAHAAETHIWTKVFFEIRRQKMDEDIGLSTKHNTGHRMACHFIFILLLNYLILSMLPVTALSKTYPGIRKYFENNVAFISSHFDDDNSWHGIATVDDAALWQEAAVKGLLSSKSYGGMDGERQVDERLMFLRVHRIINSMVLVQKRVKATDCSYQKMRPLYKHCYEGLDQGVELTSGSMKLLNGLEVPYSEEFGGFAVQLPLNVTEASEKIDELKEGRFWDRATRRSSLLFAMHNSPGHFTGNVELYFTISPFGEVLPWFNAQFLRMKPYSSLVGGTWVAALQVLVIGIWLIFLGHLLLRFRNQPHTRWRVGMLVHPWTMLEIAGHIMLTAAIVIWIGYLLNPKRTSMDFEANEYQSIMPLALDFNNVIFLMVASMILWTVRLIEFFLTFSDKSAQKTTKFVEGVIWKMGPFVLLVALVLIGFIFVGHIWFGPVDKSFSTEWKAFGTLLLWFVTLGEGQRATFDLWPGGPFFVFCFITLALILLLNMFMAVVMSAYDEINAEQEAALNFETPKKPRHIVLADSICDLLKVSPFRNDPYSPPKIDQDELKVTARKEQARSIFNRAGVITEAGGHIPHAEQPVQWPAPTPAAPAPVSPPATMQYVQYAVPFQPPVTSFQHGGSHGMSPFHQSGSPVASGRLSVSQLPQGGSGGSGVYRPAAGSFVQVPQDGSPVRYRDGSPTLR